MLVDWTSFSLVYVRDKLLFQILAADMNLFLGWQGKGGGGRQSEFSYSAKSFELFASLHLDLFRYGQLLLHLS